MIREIRILPPLAIARLGSSPAPMENYNVVVDPRQPLAFRALQGAPTLVVDRATGTITAQAAANPVRFKDGNGRVKPVAPFLEVWCERGDGVLRPLTTAILAEEGVAAANVRWQVRVSNIKAFRRTRLDADRINADTNVFSDHAVHPLTGTCTNFVQGKTIPFGDVQYLRPTNAFPEIRLRFTPAAGFVFGSTRQQNDPNVRDVVYRDGANRWSRYSGNSPMPTVPGGIFAQENGVSRGYLDDTCDGIVDVELTAGGNTLRAFARITSGPPDYAPDSMPVRTVADELEQALLGPSIEPAAASVEEAEEIVRRAFETVRLQNTAFLNGNMGPNTNTMAGFDAGVRPFAPIMAPALVDNLALRSLHQSIVTALRSETAPWFGEVLRDYTGAADLTDEGRRKMPAMMRGADGNHLALTRRQVDTIRKASTRGLHLTQANPAGGEPPPATPLNVTARAAGKPLAVQALEGTFQPKELDRDARLEQLHYRAAGNPAGTLATTAISNCFPGLEFDFRNAWKKLFVEVELHEFGPFIIDGREIVGSIGSMELNGQQIALTAEQRIPGANPGDPPEVTGSEVLELSNALALVISSPAGTKVRCVITMNDQAPVQRDLTVRGLFAGQTSVIARELALPGELTQGLCSPWQNDYRECGCYYWAASRPDYVNVEPGADGVSVGHNWLAVRDANTPKTYLPDSSATGLVTYEQLFREWERVLRFQVGGSDSE
ncbi:MAG TPA: hypothetical protein VE974_10635 [Thermoanaerobaculia bacterium]|nr:hypothetical protein [Thermoanaerobaculia bacterium]